MQKENDHFDELYNKLKEEIEDYVREDDDAKDIQTSSEFYKYLKPNNLENRIEFDSQINRFKTNISSIRTGSSHPKEWRTSIYLTGYLFDHISKDDFNDLTPQPSEQDRIQKKIALMLFLIQKFEDDQKTFHLGSAYSKLGDIYLGINNVEEAYDCLYRAYEYDNYLEIHGYVRQRNEQKGYRMLSLFEEPDKPLPPSLKPFHDNLFDLFRDFNKELSSKYNYDHFEETFLKKTDYFEAKCIFIQTFISYFLFEKRFHASDTVYYQFRINSYLSALGRVAETILDPQHEFEENLINLFPEYKSKSSVMHNKYRLDLWFDPNKNKIRKNKKRIKSSTKNLGSTIKIKINDIPQRIQEISNYTLNLLNYPLKKETILLFSIQQLRNLSDHRFEKINVPPATWRKLMEMSFFAIFLIINLKPI